MKPKARWALAGSLLVASVVLVLALRERPHSPSSVIGAGASSASGRVLIVTPAALEFGDIPLGEKRTLTLQIENPTGKTILIYRLILPCSCLSGAVEQVFVPPYQTVHLPVSFEAQPGRSSWNVISSFVTDEPGACKYDIPVAARVLQEFILEPEVMSFGKLKVGQTGSAKAVLRRRDGGVFTMVSVNSARPEFAFSWDPSTEGAVSYTITAVFTPRRQGTLMESATALTNRGGKAGVVAMLSAEVEGDLVCTPSIATAAWNRELSAASFDLLVRHRAGVPVVVRGVKESRGTPVTFLQEPGPAGECRLKISFSERIPKGVPLGEFILTIEGDTEPLRVAYRIDPPGAAPGGSP